MLQYSWPPTKLAADHTQYVLSFIPSVVPQAYENWAISETILIP